MIIRKMIQKVVFLLSLLQGILFATTTSQWTGTSNVSWGNTGNWTLGVPNGDGDEADFTVTPPPSNLPSIDASYTVGIIKFDPQTPTGYTLSNGGGSLTLSNSSNSAQLSSLSGSNTIAAPITLNSNWALSISSGSTVTVSGLISAAGQTLNLSGSGLLSLTNTSNSYTGGTTVQSAILQILGDGCLGSGSLALNGGTLRAGTAAISSSRSIALTGNCQIDTNSQTMNWNGSLGGNGSLTVLNTGGSLSQGRLILGGSNNYAGGTTIASGSTLQGTSASIPGNVTNQGALFFQQTAPGTYSGVVSGGGNWTIQGSSLALSGNSPAFTGSISILSGSNVTVTGEISSQSVTVDASSTLQGTGSVTVAPGQALTVQGTFEPGVSGQGTFTLNGDLILASTSTYLQDLSGLENAFLSATGDVDLQGGALVVDPLSQLGFFGFSKTYTILTAPNVISSFGSFSMKNPNLILLPPQYSATSIQLTIQNPRPFNGFSCSNQNTCAVSHNLDQQTVISTILPDMVGVVDAMAGLSTSQVNDALDQMTPAGLSAFTEVQTSLGGEILSLFHRTPSVLCSCSQPSRIWMEPFGSWRKEKSVGMQKGFHARTRGVAFGLDRQFFEKWTLGVGGTCSQTDLTWNDQGGYAYVKRWFGAFYSDLVVGPFYLGLSACAGENRQHSIRQIHFTTVDREAISHRRALDLEGQFTAAYFFGKPTCLLYPYATVDYFCLKNRPVSESGASSLNLRIEEQDNQTMRVEAGGALRFIDRNRDNTVCISPFLGFGYVLELPLIRNPYQAHFSSQPVSFATKGWDMAWQLLNLRFALGLTYYGLTLDSTYRIEVSPEGGTPLVNQWASFRASFNF